MNDNHGRSKADQSLPHPFLYNLQFERCGISHCVSHLLLPDMTSITSGGAAFVCVLAWVLWEFLRRVVLKTPLDNIPGPPSNSIWTGNTHLGCPLRTTDGSLAWLGNLGRMLHRYKGWDFDTELGNGPNTVVKVHGLLSVGDFADSSIQAH